MKKIYLLLIGLCLFIQLKAQVSKTIHITAGTLSSVFTSEENQTITSLTLTGTIDYRDIQDIQYGFPLLTELDLSGTIVVEVQMDGFTSMPNWWPGPTLSRNSANYGGLYKPSLTSIKLPSTLEVIGYRGFDGCTGLTEITIPPTVNTIGESAFQSCSSLTSVNLPPEIGIGRWAFSGCNALTQLPSNMTSIGMSVFVNSTGLTNVTIPEGIELIGFESFRGCSGITTLTLPESMKSLGNMAFAFCSNITTIYSYNTVPPSLRGSFDKGIYSTCIVYVPLGSAALYATAEEWKDFTHIVEMTEIELSATELSIEAVPTVQSIRITTEGAWSAVCDKEWLTVSPLAGTGDQIITFTAEANRLDIGRTAIVTVTGDALSQTITVFQKGVPKTIIMTAGSLSTVLTANELKETTELILTGEIDARDFKTLRDEMPNLARLDLSGATIVVYKGNKGTIKNLFTTYPANKIPPEAFYNKLADQKPKLTFIHLPASTESIGYNAFNSCFLMTEVKIPYALNFIDEGAFKNCSNLTYLDLITVNTIGKNAFNGCQRLISLKFPFSLKSFGEGAFLGCSALNSIYSYMSEAPYLNKFNNVFKGIDQNTCTLYVAAGSKESYEAADQWKDFKHIVEITEPTITPRVITLEPTLGSSATITVSGIGFWTFGWDQPWLDLDKGSGTDDQTITITVDEANTTGMDRICIVTFYRIGIDRQIVVVTQKAFATGVTEITQNRPSFNCYPNPFTNDITIEIQNPKHEKLTVDIYNLSGQRVKNLTYGNRTEKITLSWEGDNERGQLVPIGLYLLKVNEQITKVVKR